MNCGTITKEEAALILARGKNAEPLNFCEGEIVDAIVETALTKEQFYVMPENVRETAKLFVGDDGSTVFARTRLCEHHKRAIGINEFIA